MSLYLDASVMVPLVVTEPTTPAVEQMLRSAGQTALVSDLAAGEVASAIARQFRMGILDLEAACAALADFDAWREIDSDLTKFEPSDIRLAATFVRRFELKLRMPDAIHAATARRLGATLVTFDLRLAAAAAALGIACTVPT